VQQENLPMFGQPKNVTNASGAAGTMPTITVQSIEKTKDSAQAVVSFKNIEENNNN
jgi:hypothetical protein